MKYVVLFIVIGLVVVAGFAVVPKGRRETPPAPAVQAQPRQNRLQYDTAKCSTDPHGMVYFGVGQRVYRQPLGNISFIQGYTKEMREEAHLPLPPKPAEPEGCPDHPIQALGIYLSRLSAMPDDHEKSLYPNADRVTMEIINNPNAGLEFDEFYDSMCKAHNLRDFSIPNLTGCLKPYECDHGADYQANDYLTPTGKKFTVGCMGGANCEKHPVDCDVAYKIYSDLNIWYKFKTADVPIKDAIDCDRELRRRLEAAEVKNFPWPTEHNDQTLTAGKVP